MRPLLTVAISVSALTACERAPRPVVQPPAVAPMRGAAGDSDLRVMVSELASAKACGLIRGGFSGLRAPDHPDVVTGVLWIRECDITNAGVHVTFHITGNGWLWVDETKSQGGGTFVVRQYVRFRIDTRIRGALDIAYDRDDHIASVWFTPDRAPEVEFATIGDVAVDRQDVWSSVVGALGTVFTTSPENAAAGEAKEQGTQQLAAKLANGLAVTLNLCTGLLRVQLGRSPKGQMSAADVGETQRVPVEIEPGGVMIVGPQLVQDGMTLQAEAVKGAVRLTLVCAKHAEVVATDFMAGREMSDVPVIGTVDVRGKSRLRIKPTECPVVVVASPLDNAAARFSWERPTSEIAHASGGPLIHCPKKVKPKS